MPTSLEHWEALRESDPAAAASVLNQLRRGIFVPHTGGQREVMASQARFRILRAGRRWGKTRLAAREVLRAARKPNSMVWWVANNDRNVRRGYREVVRQMPRALLATDPPSDKANDRVLTLLNGSRIEFYTAGTPDSLVGEGVDFVVMDEAALIEESIWFQRVRPTLADTRGRALIISTPRGRNWFWKLDQRGQRGGANYASWHFTSFDNPYIDAEEIEDARATQPDLIFRQEFLAEYVANAASMFTLTDDAVLEGLYPPEGHVVLGVDLAKKEDFTVLSGCNADTRLPCYHDRFNEISWPAQEAIILDAVRDLEADPAVESVAVVVDSTGIGDVVHDHLADKGLDVIPVNFGSGNQKERMVRLLAADLEHGRARIIEQQRSEFEAYEYQITPNGRYKFEAVDGHDDEVSAKLLENWGVVHEAPPSVKTLDDLDHVRDDDEDDPETTPAEPIAPDSAQDIMARPDAWSSYGVV